MFGCWLKVFLRNDELVCGCVKMIIFVLEDVMFFGVIMLLICFNFLFMGFLCILGIIWLKINGLICRVLFVFFFVSVLIVVIFRGLCFLVFVCVLLMCLNVFLVIWELLCGVGLGFFMFVIVVLFLFVCLFLICLLKGFCLLLINFDELLIIVEFLCGVEFGLLMFFMEFLFLFFNCLLVCIVVCFGLLLCLRLYLWIDDELLF